MKAFLARRLLHAVASLVVLLAVVFIVSRLAGDPVNLYLPLNASEEDRESLRQSWGLDRSLPEQLLAFGADLLRLDLGESLWIGRPALELVLERLPATLLLGALAGIASISVALALGMAAAVRPRSLFDRSATALSLVASSLPDFWLALMLILVFAIGLGWVPTSGSGGPEFLILPVIALSVRPIGMLTQMVRTSVRESLAAPFITTARAKGLAEWRILVHHTLRNSLIPVLTVGGDLLIQMLNGAVIIETVFGWPGIGKLTIDAIGHRDFALIQASVIVVAAIVFVVNLLLDVSYAVLDPRIRLQ